MKRAYDKFTGKEELSINENNNIFQVDMKNFEKFVICSNC